MCWSVRSLKTDENSIKKNQACTAYLIVIITKVCFFCRLSEFGSNFINDMNFSGTLISMRACYLKLHMKWIAHAYFIVSD